MRALLLVALLLLLPALATATHYSDPICRPRSIAAVLQGTNEVNLIGASRTFYIDDRGYLLGNGVYVYQESNGVFTNQGFGLHRTVTTMHNLQRGGDALIAAVPPAAHEDPCDEPGSDDTLVQ